MLRRQIPGTCLEISPVALGCWPMAGISSLGVSDSQSEATVEAALESGINHFDTAYSYGFDGRSDRVLRKALASRWDKVVLASKVGSHYTPDGQRVIDSTPQRLLNQADEIRDRLGVDCIDLLYLHAPDGITPIEKAAEALASLQACGKIRHVGLSNADAEQTIRFASVIAPVMLQPSYNMLQPDVVDALRPAIDSLGCGVAAYWPLMKGLLAGKLTRDHVFDAADRRLTYPIYQGEQWERNQDFLDKLRSIASEIGWSVPRLVVHWTMIQPSITTVLCGAKRPEQIRESAEALQGSLPESALAQIDRAIQERRALG